MLEDPPVDAREVLPPEGLRLLTAATMLSEPALTPEQRGAWRLEAYFSRIWTVLHPPIFEEGLSAALQIVRDAHRPVRDIADLHARSRAVQSALDLLEPTDVPLRAQLHTVAMQDHLDLRAEHLTEAAKAEALGHALAVRDLLSATTLRPSWEAADMCTVATDVLRAFGQPAHAPVVAELAALAVSIAPQDDEDPNSRAYALMLRHNLALCLFDDPDPHAMHRAEQEFRALTAEYREVVGETHRLTSSVVASLIRAMKANGGSARTDECLQIGEAQIDESIIRNPHRGSAEDANLIVAVCDVYIDRHAGDPRANLERAMTLSSAAIEILRRHPQRFREYAKVLRQRASMERFTDTVSGRSSRQSALRYAAGALELLLPEPGVELSLDAARAADEYANCLMMVPFSPEDARLALDFHSLALDVFAVHYPEGNAETYRTKLDALITEHQVVFNEQSLNDYFVPDGSLDTIIDGFRDLAADASHIPEARDTWRAATSHLAQLLLQSRSDNDSVREAVEFAWASLAAEEPSRQAGFNRTETYLVGTLLAERGRWADAGDFFQEAVRWFRLQNRALLSIESKMADAREGAGLSVRAAYCLARAGRVAEAAAAFEDTMDLWLNDVRRSYLPAPATIARAGPEIWERYRDLSQRLAAAQASEISSGRPWTLPDRKTEYGDQQRSIQRELESVRSGFEALTAAIRDVPGFETFSFHDEPAGHSPRLELDRPVVYLGVSAWGGVAVILDGKNQPEAILDDTYAHDDLVRFLVSRDQHGHGYSDGQLGDQESLANALSHLADVAPRLIDRLAERLTARGCAAILIPSGALALLPIHAMGSGPIGASIAISYLTSLAALSTPKVNGQAGASLDYLGILGNRDGLPGEEGSNELRSAASHFDRDRVQLLMDGATADRAAAAMRSAAVVHFVGHGQFELGEPQFSSLDFADGSRLRFADVYRTELAETELVVVSACKTAVRARVPAESVSIASSFLTAGARTILGTLWETNDLASTLLVSYFFDIHFGGSQDDYPTSLLAAQRWLRESTREQLLAYWNAQPWREPPMTLLRGDPSAQPFESPVYWAQFIIVGAPTRGAVAANRV